MENDVLGKEPEPRHERDAIHVAIVPVLASEELQPGTHVGIDTNFRAIADGKKIGIVDPFRREPIKKGKPFWLLLYPNTITGMRHHWSHPSFVAAGSSDDLELSRLFVEKCAAVCGKTTEALIDDCRQFIHNGGGDGFGWIYDNSERYKDFDEWETFPKHLERLTGLKMPDHEYGTDTCPYTCSC